MDGSKSGHKFIVLAMWIISGCLIILPVAADPQTALVGNGCSGDDYKYVNATAFNENLNAVLTSLRSNISKTGFATSEQTKGTTDPVYGLAQCRNYLASNDCQQCYAQAEKQIRTYCSSQKYNGGRIHLDGCFLRYENTSFFTQGTDGGASNYCGSINDSEPQEFSEKAQMLLTKLITNASTNGGYTIGSIAVESSSEAIYGLANCWPSLSSSTCNECLQDALIQVKKCFQSSNGRGLEAGCFMRYSTSDFFSNNQTSSTPNLSEPSSKKKSKLLPILLGSIGGAVLIIAVLCVMFTFRHSLLYVKLQSKKDSRDGDLLARESFEQVIFDYEVLRNATGNFGNDNVLGGGGFGKVYKGNLPDGRQVAVKKLNGSRTTQAMAEFVTEVKLISSARHRNLVRLLGCCTLGHERLLVYEYMPNNSLDKHLFGDIINPLNWEIRFDLIVGTARGLAYLHEDSNVRIVHRDIKCGNILLDDKFHPKIADFGLAKFFPEGQTHLSSRVGGTIGYTAPEYAVHGQLSEKADVYSYGVVVLEIVSGRKCMNTRLPEHMQLLLEWAWNEYESDQVLGIIDTKLEGMYPQEQVLRVITIALLCTQGTAVLRPSMSQVMSMLTSDSEIVVRPTRPAFISSIGSGRNGLTASAMTSETRSSESHGSISASFLPR
eukprot:Gb_11949 [translate_table: standard]